MKRIFFVLTVATLFLSASLSAEASASRAVNVSVGLLDFQIDISKKKVKHGRIFFSIVARQGTHGFCIKDINGQKSCAGTLIEGQDTVLGINRKKGTYRYWCPLGNHASKGMKGKLRVT